MPCEYVLSELSSLLAVGWTIIDNVPNIRKVSTAQHDKRDTTQTRDKLRSRPLRQNRRGRITHDDIDPLAIPADFP